MATDTLPTPKPALPTGDPDRPTNRVIPAVLLVGLVVTLVLTSIWAALTIAWSTHTADNQEIKFVFRRLEESVRPFGEPTTSASIQTLRVGLLVGVPVLFLGLAAGAFFLRRSGRAVPWLAKAGLAATGLGALYIAYSLVFLGLFRNINAWLFWIPLLLLYSAVFIAYVVGMYVQDGRSVGWLWASFLGLLRVSVYALLVLVFLLPALQTWDKSESFSRVLVALDLSGSMGLSDDLPQENSTRPPRTRLDQVVALLTKNNGAFFKGEGEKKGLLDTNPVYVYPFGGRLDDEAKEFKKEGKPWPESEWNGYVRQDLRQWILDGLSDVARERVQKSRGFENTQLGDPAQWAANWFKESDLIGQLDAKGEEKKWPDGFSKEDAELLMKKRDGLLKKLEARQQIAAGTNYPDALFGLSTRESNNMIAGVIVIGDGQSNQGSASTLAEALQRFHNLKVPIFTVAIGEVREQINIRITDLQVPEMSPPDEKFPVRIIVEGEGLADQDFNGSLDLFKPGQDPAKDKPAHTLPIKGKFKAGGGVPHGQIELVIDPASPEMAAVRKTGPTAPAKPEFEEGEWKFRARVPKAKGEAFAGREHVSDVPASIQLVKRPLRVLLVSGGAGREYQFCRRLFANESDKKRAELSVFQQFTDPKGDRALDVDPERLLKQFPNVYEDKKESSDKAEDRYYNLARYDLIVAFDPDWTRIAPASLKLLEQWVDAGGGLIVVAGPINTYQLARGANEKALGPVIGLYPVRVDDSRLSALGVERTTTKPYPLNFPGASTETEFLKLDDDSKYPLAGWSAFFYGKPKDAELPRYGTTQDPVLRGFYSFYPIKSVKPGATVVATFGDPQARLAGDDAKNEEMPFLVTMPSKKGKVVYLGWEGTWRLRQFKEEYFERFWTKLARYAGSGNLTRQSRRGVPIMGRQFTAGRPIGFEAQLFQQNMQPLAKTADPRIKITPPPGVTLPRAEFPLAPKREGTWEGYFRAQFTVNSPGKYQLELPIPDSNEILRREFYVKETNLELDNSRPNLAALEGMASEVNKLRVSDAKKAELRKLLRAASGDKAAGPGKDGDARLFFDLKNAHLIPEYLDTDYKTQLSRGRIEDLWSDGPTFGPAAAHALAWTVSSILLVVGLGLAVLGVVLLGRGSAGSGLAVLLIGAALACALGGVMLFLFPHVPLSSMTISTVLFLVVGLLSAEWLTRKLLKLA